jgi:hypothetical protein
MSKPFVFHFSRGDNLTPKIMVIVDLLAECGTCGYEEIQRFYRGVAFHSLNAARWRALTEEAPQLLSYECSNCGERVGPEMGQKGALAYGFADGAGVLESFFAIQGGRGVNALHHLRGGAKLDAQALPRWDAQTEDARELTTRLDEDAALAAFGRVMSLKVPWRALLARAARDGEASVVQPAPGTWLLAATPQAPVEALIERDPALAAALREGSAVRSSLLGPVRGLFWWRGVATTHGIPGAWLAPEARAALSSGEVVAEAVLSWAPALEALVGALERARLTCAVQGEGADAVVVEIKTPRELPWGGEIPLRAVLACAAHTAILGPEAARMTAEEIIAELLGLTLQSA